MMFGSYNKFHNRIDIDAAIVSSLDFFTSLIASCVIFSVLGQEPEDREDDAGRDEGGEEVEGGDDGGVNVDAVVELVVRAEHHQTAPVRKYLGCRDFVGLLRALFYECVFGLFAYSAI